MRKIDKIILSFALFANLLWVIAWIYAFVFYQPDKPEPFNQYALEVLSTGVIKDFTMNIYESDSTYVTFHLNDGSIVELSGKEIIDIITKTILIINKEGAK